MNQAALAHDDDVLLDDEIILTIARSLSGSSKLEFKMITSPTEWAQLGEFRLSNYQIRKPYMIAEMASNGLDEYDKNSLTYVACLNNEILASVRLCPYPFETLQFIAEDRLQQFLGNNYKSNYLEWSRLLISDKIRSPRLLSGLIIFTGMKILSTTPYEKYFGYSTPLIKRLFSKFDLDNEILEFNINRRGEHKYLLLKGDFAKGFTNLIRKKFRL